VSIARNLRKFLEVSRNYRDVRYITLSGIFVDNSSPSRIISNYRNVDSAGKHSAQYQTSSGISDSRRDMLVLREAVYFCFRLSKNKLQVLSTLKIYLKDIDDGTLHFCILFIWTLSIVPVFK
jgi:hypothetical protein